MVLKAFLIQSCILNAFSPVLPILRRNVNREGETFKIYFSFKPYGSINKVPSFNLQTKCNFELRVVIGNILIFTEISYSHVMYCPMFIELCAVVYFEGLWSYAIVNLKNLFSICK